MTGGIRGPGPGRSGGSRMTSGTSGVSIMPGGYFVSRYTVNLYTGKRSSDGCHTRHIGGNWPEGRRGLNWFLRGGGMAGPLLATKLHVPRRQRSLVARPRLSERLSRGAESALTLVSAPAGFGKTTLLAQWLAAAPADGRSVAWLSLDQRDNDPELFWTYLVGALKTAAQGAGAGALSLLQPPQPPAEAGLATLLNDLDAVSDDVVLVLDDYHVIEARGVQDGMAFLLEHLPPQIHLVIASRADPALPLARLRGRGELVEIRAADLRFTPDEAAAYLNEVMGLVLTAAGCRGAGGAHRRVDRRAPAGGALAAGARGRRRVHRRLRRGRPLHRRLPGRGGLAAAARACPAVPAADLHPGPAERPAVRCRHRPGRWPGQAGGAGAREPVPGPAG